MYWFENYNFAETKNYFSSIDKIRSGSGEKLADFIILSTRAVSSVIFGLWSCWKLGLSLLTVFPVSIFFFVLTVNISKKYKIKESESNLRSESIFKQVFSSLKTVLVLGGKKLEIDNYENALKNVEHITMKKSTVTSLTSAISVFFNNISYAIWVGYGTYLIRNECDQFEPGEIIQTFASFIISTMALSQAFPFLSEIQDAKLAAMKLFKIIDNNSEGSEIKNNKASIKFETFQANIDLKNLTFAYKSNLNNLVLDNLNIKINSGQTVALIGPSGCGKSTLVKLISRINVPLSGSIDINGKNLNDIDLNWWRDQISIVSQEPVLFNLPFRDNIRLGNLAASDADIENAAKLADIHDFIQSTSNKYDTIVDGSKLSGGQRQRVSIARAFLKTHAKILIFDEATSALDTKTEKFIQESIKKLRKNRTTIIIAHRLSTIRDADLIIELNKGKITDYGSHEDLIKKKGYYYSIISKEEIKHKKQKLDENEIEVIVNSNELEVDDNRETIKRKKRYLFSKILALSRPEWYWIIFSSLFYLINGATYPLIAFCFSEMVKIFTIQDEKLNFEQSIIFTIAILSISIVSFIATFFMNFATTKSGIRLTVRVKNLLFRSLINKDMEWLDREENKLSSLELGMCSYPQLLKGYTIERMGIIFNTIGGVCTPMIISLYYSWKLGFVVSLFIPISLAWGFVQGQGIRANMKLSGLNKIQEAIKHSDEIIQKIQTVRVNNLSEYFKEKLDFEFRSNTKRITIVILVESIFYAIGYVLYFFVQLTAFSYGSYLLKNREIEAHNIVRIFLSILFSSMFLGKNISNLPDVPKAKKAAKWIFNILELKKKTNDEKLSLKLENLKGHITFENVDFSFGSKKKILNNLNLEFPAKQSSAMVGKSGSGKSTIMSLILGFYKPDNGKILIDGIDYQKIDKEWFWSQIGLVSQESVFFSGTIKDNILYGLDRTKFSDNDVITASIQANAHQFITKLPQGYDTDITNSSLKLSGGQRQRISIARSLIRKPKVLFLDEATSALDVESEKIIQETISNNSLNRTCLSIAHRLSTIKDSDRIFVIDNGTVVEQGKHAQLLKLKGVYYKLYNFS